MNTYLDIVRDGDMTAFETANPEQYISICEQAEALIQHKLVYKFRDLYEYAPRITQHPYFHSLLKIQRQLNVCASKTNICFKYKYSYFVPDKVVRNCGIIAGREQFGRTTDIDYFDIEESEKICLLAKYPHSFYYEHYIERLKGRPGALCHWIIYRENMLIDNDPRVYKKGGLIRMLRNIYGYNQISNVGLWCLFNNYPRCSPDRDRPYIYRRLYNIRKDLKIDLVTRLIC